MAVPWAEGWVPSVGGWVDSSSTCSVPSTAATARLLACAACLTRGPHPTPPHAARPPRSYTFFKTDEEEWEEESQGAAASPAAAATAALAAAVPAT